MNAGQAQHGSQGSQATGAQPGAPEGAGGDQGTAAGDAAAVTGAQGQATSQAPLGPGDNSGGASAQPTVVDRPGQDQVDEARVAGVAAPNSDAQATRLVRANANVLGHTVGDEFEAPDDAELSGVLAAGLVTDVAAERAQAQADAAEEPEAKPARGRRGAGEGRGAKGSD